MMSKKNNVLAALLVLGVGHIPTNALALVKWTLTSADCISATGGACDQEYASSRTFKPSDSEGPNVTATGWANTIGTNTRLEMGEVAQYDGGLGVRNADHPDSGRSSTDGREGTNPEHAMDNDERFDLVLFDFGGVDIRLSEVTLGWYSGDSDITVLAYTGIGDILNATHLDYFGARTYTSSTQDLTDYGWQVIGSYDVDSTDNTGSHYVQPIDTDVSSSFWIVGAYNPVFASNGCETTYCNGPASYPDFVKVKKLAGHTDVAIPEPGTLLLLLTASLPLIARASRRNGIQPAYLTRRTG